MSPVIPSSIPRTATESLEGFRVPPPEILLRLKLATHHNRSGSAKGRKDLIDIVSLLLLPYFNWSKIPASVLDLLKYLYPNSTPIPTNSPASNANRLKTYPNFCL